LRERLPPLEHGARSSTVAPCYIPEAHFAECDDMVALPTNETDLHALLAREPGNPATLAALGMAMVQRIAPATGMPAAGDLAAAVGHLRDAIRLGNRAPGTLKAFIDALNSLETIPAEWDVSDALITTLQSGLFEVRPAMLALLNGLSRGGASISDAIQLAWAGRKEKLAALLDDAAVRDALGHPVFTTALRTIILGSLEIELLLTLARRRLLLLLATGQAATALHPSERAFCHGLAHQCFLTEYAFWQEPDEAQWCDTLAESFAARLAADAAADTFPAAVLACYRPLSAFSFAPELSRRHGEGEPGGFTSLVQRQIHEPALERALAAALPEVAPITDAVSRSVKQQYEENPYPRWTTPPRYPRRPFRETVREKYPHADFSALDPVTRPEILVAGCGTGEQIFSTIGGHESWNVTAIDISRASLAYARRQTEAHGVEHVTYVVCDILDVPLLRRDFDIIECVGVLHHMGEPLQGWRTLVEHLRPGGIMVVGLYSTIARSGIRAARKYAAEHGYEPTADGIRRFRRDVTNALRGAPHLRAIPAQEWGIALSHDFHSVSMCRDLVFHVQERTYALPEVADMIAALGLRLVHFMPASPADVRAYRAQFPEDKTLLNLSNWDAFERAHPSTFRNMYHFAVQKPLL
jgi:2-polyprenyl-3-methyl-5-hydroxy-6-metoxy-1,4-benzoquinol methylase